MNNFIDNVNKYIEHYGIKQTVIALKSDIEKNKLSRLLSGKQELKAKDMEDIASALEKDIMYFLEDLELNEIRYDDYTSIAFNMGTPNSEKESLANTVFDFLEHIDAIMGIPKKIKKYSKEGDFNGL